VRPARSGQVLARGPLHDCAVPTSMHEKFRAGRWPAAAAYRGDIGRIGTPTVTVPVTAPTR